jgi:hypothetical protein
MYGVQVFLDASASESFASPIPGCPRQPTQIASPSGIEPTPALLRFCFAYRSVIANNLHISGGIRTTLLSSDNVPCIETVTVITGRTLIIFLRFPIFRSAQRHFLSQSGDIVSIGM